MAEEQKGAGEVAPAPVAPVEPAKEPASVTMTSDALTKRLGEERTSHEKQVRADILRELGVSELDDVKGAVAEAAKLKQASMSETERLNARIKELEPHQAASERVGARFKALVDAQFGALPDAAQKAIDKHAAGDAEKRFDMIELMRESGALATLGHAPEAVKPPGPSSVTPSPAPPPSGVASKFDEWQAMRARNATMGDIFYQNHTREIERTRPASA